ncbi:MAG: hypothetical protein ABI777_00855, partial [Betaproteobacteria bacterium]
MLNVRAFFPVMLLVGLMMVVGPRDVAAGVVWWNGDFALTRLESDTGQMRVRNFPTRIRTVAPLADGGTWIVAGNIVERIGMDLEPSLTVATDTDPANVPTFSAATRDGGLWIVHGRSITRLNASGVEVIRWLHPLTALAFAYGGPDSLWVGDATGVHQYTADGVLVRSASLRSGGVPKAIVLDAIVGYLWVVTATFATQFDVFAGLQERAALALSPTVTTVAMDVNGGTLWLLSHRHLDAYDRNAAPIGTWMLPGGMVVDASALAVDALYQRLWVGDVHGTTAFNRETMQWIRLTDGERTTEIAGSHHQLAPRVLLGAITGPPVTVRLQLGATCNGVPCVATPRYLATFDLSASIGDFELGDRFSLDPGHGTADLQNIDSFAVGDMPLRVSAVDGYGTRSDELVLDL